MIKRFIIIILNSSRISKSLILLAVSFFFALISFSNNAFSLPFCNSITSPATANPAISGGNCVLPSCNVLPQSLTGSRNPGVNCLADCNAMPVGINPIQGQNCLFDCNNLPAGTDPKIGGNCAFSINGFVMPFCNPVPTPIGYTLNSLSRYVLEAGITKDPRVNCADLIDLPLCSMANPNNRIGKNCVEKCNNITGSTEDLSRKHNRDCLRICSEPEAGASASALADCSQKKCHHLIGTATIPNPGSNCEIQKCSNLTGYELNKTSLYTKSTSNYKYCDASIKCLNFNKSQLDTILATYNAITDLKTSPLFRICQQHDCRTEFNGSCAPYASDDTAKIQDKASYNTAYINTIIKTASPTSSDLNNLCKIKICRGLLTTQLPCSGAGLTIINPSCTTPATCDSSGYCIKKVDCDSSSLPDIDRSIYCDGTPVAQAPASKDHSNAYPYLIEKTWFYLPKPMDKSYQNNDPSSQPFRVMDVANMCYRVSDMTHATNDFGKMENTVLGWFGDLIGRDPYFHDYLSYPTRSPNICSPTFRNGTRGLGYSYLCGATDFNHPPDMQAVGYIDSITSTWGKESVVHKLRVCLRYNNAMIPQRTCGARECGITCAFADCSSVCGFDECRELTISDSSVRGCEDPTNTSGDCVAQIGGGSDIDSYIRVRAVGFPDDSRVCAILDWKGGLANDEIFMKGDEHLAEDKTKCLSGSYDKASDKCTGGKNSHDDKGRADIWRALGLIKYIDSNFTSANSIKGIKDLAGNFYPESSCIRRQIRAAPPNFYNLANYENSPGLFSPPLIIKSVRKKKGGEISPTENPAKYAFGVTDFNQPEVEILFGTTTALLSLDTGKTGNESASNADINGFKHLTTTVAGKTFPAYIYVKKSSDPFGNPQFCVYRKLLDKSNVEITPPPSIGCVRRNSPEIDKCDSRDGLCISLTSNINQNYREKILLSKVEDNTLENYKKIILKFIFLVNYNNSDISNLTCPASNTGSNITCSPELSIPFNLTDRKEMSYCYSTIEGLEGYPTCFTRDDCSILNMECMENEVKISSGDSTVSLLSMQEGCYQKLLTCNKKKNIISQNFDPITFNGNAQDNYYGWFNEICLTKGFNHKLKTIYAYKISTQNGKCIVDPTKATPGADCSSGGKMPNCPCTEYVLGSTPAHIQSINSINRLERLETPHEAGLCIDIPLPKTCRAINYLPGINTANPDDKFFITSSINKLVGVTSYNDSTGVHTSHKFRTEGTSQNPLRGNAEYNSTIVGSSSKGRCNGFWKHKTSSGNIIYPELSCNLNGAQEAEWNSSITDPNSGCERYSCKSITSQGILDLNSDQYQNNYGSHEIGFNKGASDGYAYWNSYLNTTDFASERTATSCITGTRKKDSTISIDYSRGSYTIPASLRSDAKASFFGLITGYNNGELPTRICNQRGEWQAPINSCERITCPPFNPGRSAPGSFSSDERKLWRELWKKSGGAVFSYQPFTSSQTEAQYVSTVTYASRSTGIVKGSGLSSKISGQCQTNLGFYSSGTPPTLNCDQYGNWTGLENACLSNCSEITASDSNFGIGSGFAEWPEGVIDADKESSIVTGSCNSTNGQYPYPYPPRRNAKGERYTLSSSPNSANNEISDTVSYSSATSLPVRTCSKSIFNEDVRNKWEKLSTTCVSVNPGTSNNGCVSGIYDSVNAPDDLMVDERINAGRTQHYVRNPSGSNILITIPWARRQFGEYQIRYCSSSNNYCQNSVDDKAGTHYSANYYSATKTSNYGLFTLVRYCNPTTKKWNPPYPVCIASGSLENNLHATAESPASLNVFAGDSVTPRHYVLANNDGSDDYKIPMICESGYEIVDPQYLRCQSTNSAVLDMFQLNKVNTDTNRNTCRKYCEFFSTGNPKTAGNAHTSLTSSYTNISKVYSGDVVNFSCNSSNPCGTSKGLAIEGRCSDSGWTIASFQCKTCDGCTSSSPTNLDSLNASGAQESTKIYTKTVSNECVTERFDPLCLLKNAKSFPASTAHGNAIGIYKQKNYDDCWSQVWKDGRVCGAAKFICDDGTWKYDNDLTHSWVCDRTSNYSYESNSDCTVGHHWEQRYSSVTRPSGVQVCCTGADSTGTSCDNTICGK